VVGERRSAEPPAPKVGSWGEHQRIEVGAEVEARALVLKRLQYSFAEILDPDPRARYVLSHKSPSCFATSESGDLQA
jgi:hypothetical protein